MMNQTSKQETYVSYEHENIGRNEVLVFQDHQEEKKYRIKWKHIKKHFDTTEIGSRYTFLYIEGREKNHSDIT